MLEDMHRLRMTKQRKVILEELRKVTSHPTAGDLCDMVRRRLPKISLGTVYRNLDILSRQGIITKLDVAGQEMRFDGNVEQHYHLRCRGCGRVDDLFMDPLPGLDEAAEKMSQYQVFGHSLEFVGICPECAGKKTATDSLREAAGRN